MIQQIKHLLRRQRILILLFNASHFIGNAPMHIYRTFFINIPEAILHRILIHPHTGSQLVAAKIGQSRLKSLVEAKSFFGVHILLLFVNSVLQN